MKPIPDADWMTERDFTERLEKVREKYDRMAEKAGARKVNRKWVSENFSRVGKARPVRSANKG